MTNSILLEKSILKDNSDDCIRSLSLTFSLNFFVVKEQGFYFHSFAFSLAENIADTNPLPFKKKKKI